MRGRAMPKREREVGDENADGGDDQLVRHQPRHVLDGHVDCRRHHGELRRPQEHHRPGRLGEEPAGEFAHEFGLAGMLVADLVQDRLRDRQRDDGRGCAVGNEFGTAFDGRDRARRVRWVRLAGYASRRAFEPQDGKRAGKAGGGLLRRDRLERHRQAEVGGGAPAMVEIADEQERVGLAPQPRLAGDLQPDAGGIAAAERE